MFKFGTIGAYKQVRNNPRCKATQNLVAGLVVLPDDATGLAPTPSTEALAKGDVWVVGNIIDKPEINNKADFTVEAGEYVRTFNLADLKGLPVELSADTVSDDYTTLVVGDVLVPAADSSGKWVKGEATGYKVALKVLEKTTFGDKGLYCSVVVA